MPVDAAVTVHVIQLEIPAQLVLHLPPHHQAERGHVLHKVYVTVLQPTRKMIGLSQQNIFRIRMRERLFLDQQPYLQPQAA